MRRLDDRRLLRRNNEQMAGFWIMRANDLDAALEWAAMVAAACEGRSRSDPPKLPDPLAEYFPREAGRSTATLIRVLGGIDLAEDAVAEAFAIAAEQWPTRGVSPNPGGCITTTARNRAIDGLRSESTRTDLHLAARADLLARAGEPDAALAAYDRAVGPPGGSPATRRSGAESAPAATRPGGAGKAFACR